MGKVVVMLTETGSYISGEGRTIFSPFVITGDNIALDWRITGQIVSETLPLMKKEECEQTQCQDGDKNT